MIEGIIIKGIGGFYYVDTQVGLIECRARGVFRKNKIKPLVGDYVLIRITKEDEKTGYIEEIKERKNEVKRPAVANIDQLVIVFSVKNPNPNFLLLDKLIIASEVNLLEPVICFNKIDLVDDEECIKYKDMYKNTGYDMIFTSKYNEESINQLRKILENKTTVFSGPSGVGKSSLMNAVQPNFSLKTGEISEKLKRGKHTTRHAEIMKLDFGGWVVDTPGFSSYNLENIDYHDLYNYFKDIKKFSNHCKYRTCLHYKEPDCSVKDALNNELISYNRYNNYIKLLEEIKNGGKNV